MRPLSGKSLIWLAAMAPAFVGIIALVANAAHAFRAYVALQRATDAACEAAAVAAVDVNLFIAKGKIRLVPTLARAAAAQVFRDTLAGVNLSGASLTVRVQRDAVACSARARIPLLVRLPGLSDFQVSVWSASRARGISR